MGVKRDMRARSVGAASGGDTGVRPKTADLVGRLHRAWGESVFYQSKLKGPAPDRLSFQPVDPHTPDKEFATSFAKGVIHLGDAHVDCEGELARLWRLSAEHPALEAYLQRFVWLRHLSVLGEEARAPIQTYMRAWLDAYEKWSPDAWAPGYAAERLTHLCAYGDLVLGEGDALWRSRVLSSMARQTRHLAHSAHRAETAYERLTAALGLSLVAICLPGCDDEAERGLALLRREMRLQLRPDGGHVSRNPSVQLEISVRLHQICAAMRARNLEPHGFLRHTLARTSALAHFFRCGDGKLAVFNGGYEDDPRTIIELAKCVDEDNLPTAFARHSGYQKLSAARTLVIADVETKPSAQSSGFAGEGAFHFSSGRSRIVGNCGSAAHLDGEWRGALQRRDAHSALCFEAPDGQAAPMTAPLLGSGRHRRGESNDGQLIEYERELLHADVEQGIYERRLFLSLNGTDFRGHEILTGLTPALNRRALWRFHLHPNVRASVAMDGASVLLALPNKEGWRFRVGGGDIAIDKSVYAAQGGAPLSCEQIIVRPSAQMLERPQIDIRWAFKRLDPVG